MRRVVARHLLGLGTDIEAGCAVGAAQPDAADLVGVDVAERLLVQDVFEVCGGIARVEDGVGGDFADVGAVLSSAVSGKKRAGVGEERGSSGTT